MLPGNKTACTQDVAATLANVATSLSADGLMMDQLSPDYAVREVSSMNFPSLSVSMSVTESRVIYFGQVLLALCTHITGTGTRMRTQCSDVAEVVRTCNTAVSICANCRIAYHCSLM